MSTTLDDPAHIPTATGTDHSPQEHPTPTPAQAAATPPPAPDPERPRPELDRPLSRDELVRPMLGAMSTTIGTAFLVGGMFVGFTPRIYAAIGGIAGCILALWAARATKRHTLVQVLSILGVVVIAMILLGISDVGAITKIKSVVSEAAGHARLHKPPAAFELGWRFILPLTLGMIGYAATWIGSAGRKPAVGVLFPQILVMAFAAIAQPAEAQVPAGIVAFVTFVVGLAVIYRADRGEGEGVSTAYELKRAARTAPLVIVLVGALVALSQTGFLFPKPLYDPTEKATLPHPVPLQSVKDRILFTCHGQFTGPWRVGVLDVYDSTSWRIPPFDESKFKPIPPDGVVDTLFENPVAAQVRSDCSIQKLDGTVLPLPARMHSLHLEQAPQLVVDPRTQTVRVKEGAVLGLSYQAAFAVLPKPEELRAAGSPDQQIIHDYTDTGQQAAPPDVRALIDKISSKTHNKWDLLDGVRRTFLDTVESVGGGVPVPVPPAKVEDMLTGSKRGSPYEIVAGQALLARWVGVPSRIGYGFDWRPSGTDTGKDGILAFHPKHGSSWLEVYFQGYGWLPITGLPTHSEATIGDSKNKLDAPVLPGKKIALSLFLPLRVSQSNFLFKQIQKALLLLLPFIIIGLLVWILWPYVYKLRRRSARRQWALQQGRTARIAVAYTDLRDMATDLGVGDPYATPLAYVQKVIPDDEHAELAWLVTRCLWGDLKDNVTDDEVFAAEELSRSLRRRMFEAQPFTIRGIALVSRLSLRDPYAPELLSPVVQKFEIKKLVRVPARLRRRVPVPEENLDEALDTV